MLLDPISTSPGLWSMLRYRMDYHTVVDSLTSIDRSESSQIWFVFVVALSTSSDLLSPAVLYTFGNVISMSSTAFLFGPCSQIKKMFEPERAPATVIYLCSMALTLFCAFKLRAFLPVIACLIVQFLAMVWCLFISAFPPPVP